MFELLKYATLKEVLVALNICIGTGFEDVDAQNIHKPLNMTNDKTLLKLKIKYNFNLLKYSNHRNILLVF